MSRPTPAALTSRDIYPLAHTLSGPGDGSPTFNLGGFQSYFDSGSQNRQHQNFFDDLDNFKLDEPLEEEEEEEEEDGPRKRPKHQNNNNDEKVDG